MSNLTIAALNCQGLGDYKKRRDVFQYLKQKRFDIYFLEDTHFDVKLERQIRSEWGYQCCFSSYSTQARGVAILFNSTFDFKINNVLKDDSGNYLVVNLTTMEKTITLVNIYGPNKDDPEFYEKNTSRITRIRIFQLCNGRRLEPSFKPSFRLP